MILCILKGEMPFKMYKIIFCFQKKNVYLPYLKFSDPFPKTHFILPEQLFPFGHYWSVGDSGY